MEGGVLLSVFNLIIYQMPNVDHFLLKLCLYMNRLSKSSAAGFNRKCDLFTTCGLVLSVDPSLTFQALVY